MKYRLTAWHVGLWRRLLLFSRSVLAASLPNRCLMCHQTVAFPQQGICGICLAANVYHQPVCLGCGRVMQQLHSYCGACMQARPIKVIAPASYHSGLGAMVAAIKYQGQLAALPPLVEALARRICLLQQAGLITLPQAIIAVPLHPARLRQRGFNQAWLIAVELGGILGIPVLTSGLTRVCDTRPQAGLTGKQRRRNLSGAFCLDDDFAYQRIALVDDVVTTGTTVSEIAQLFERRYVQVQVWCLVRAEAPHLNEQ